MCKCKNHLGNYPIANNATLMHYSHSVVCTLRYAGNMHAALIPNCTNSRNAISKLESERTSLCKPSYYIYSPIWINLPGWPSTLKLELLWKHKRILEMQFTVPSLVLMIQYQRALLYYKKSGGGTLDCWSTHVWRIHTGGKNVWPPLCLHRTHAQEAMGRDSLMVNKKLFKLGISLYMQREYKIYAFSATPPAIIKWSEGQPTRTDESDDQHM